jgi:formylmethanofuran dehydrogenase subunit E
VDAIQSLTGCTFGKGNLVHLDYGKNAFTFIRRSDGRSIRVAVLPEGWGKSDLDLEHQALREKIDAGLASDEDRKRFNIVHQERARAILDLPLEHMFSIQPVEPHIPAHARIHDSVLCSGCGEKVMETRARLFQGENYCIPCFSIRDRR